MRDHFLLKGGLVCTSQATKTHRKLSAGVIPRILVSKVDTGENELTMSSIKLRNECFLFSGISPITC